MIKVVKENLKELLVMLQIERANLDAQGSNLTMPLAFDLNDAIWLLKRIEELEAENKRLNNLVDDKIKWNQDTVAIWEAKVKKYREALEKIAFGSLEKNFHELKTNKPDQEIAKEALGTVTMEFKKEAERLLDKHLAPLKQPYLVEDFSEALNDAYEKGLDAAAILCRDSWNDSLHMVNQKWQVITLARLIEALKRPVGGDK